MQLEIHSPKRRFRVPVLLAFVSVLLVTIGLGFALRLRATQLEEFEDVALQMRSELHESDAVLLSVLVSGAVMAERKGDLISSIERLRALADELTAAGLAPDALTDEIDDFGSGAQSTISAIEDGDPLATLVRIHDEVIVVSFLNSSELVDEIVSEISENAADNRRLADLGALVEVLVVMGTAAGSASWLRTLSSTEAAVVEKDRFIASVSHELRTPLTGVLGMAQILTESQDLSSEDRELAEIIAQQSSDMGHLIEDLLVAARATMSDLSIVPEQMVACEQVQIALGAITHPEAKTLTCESVGVMEIFSDPLRFRQIVRNLITNAIRYGGGDIGIDAYATNGMAVVAISDAGQRLPADDVVEIFEPYTRGKGPTVTGSVGLGLPVARLLAQRLGGDLVYRHRGGRNVFELQLPIEPGHEPVDARVALGAPG